jgi:hypothetical protein
MDDPITENESEAWGDQSTRNFSAGLAKIVR